MAITREFLGFELPALVAATQFLIDRADTGPCVDLEPIVVVVPGARAGRHLRQRLLLEVQARGKGLLPPTIVTVSHLPELLYQPKRPFATHWVQQLTWTRALALVGRAIRTRIAPRLEADFDGAGPSSAVAEDWLDVGRMLWRQYRELAAEGLSFADVAERGNALEGFGEGARWRALATVQNEYLQALDAEHLWDKQTARLVAVRQQECHFEGEIVLLGTVDLSRTMREMLDQVGDCVTALVHAPAGWAERFDAYGCIDPRAWELAEIDFEEDHWSVCYGPQEQGQRITELMQAYDGQYAISEVVVGCADPNLVPFVQRSLNEHQVPSHWSAGWPIEQTSPVRLLSALADLLDGGRFPRFAEWVRHPDVITWLASNEVHPNCIPALDAYYNEFLPTTWTEPFRGEHPRWQTARRALVQMRRLLDPLPRTGQPLTSWMPRIRKVLSELYRCQNVARHDPHTRTKLEACQVIDQALAEMATLPKRLDMDVSAPVILRLIVTALAGERASSPIANDGVELLGWLELPLDESPAMIVTGFNEGLVPQSVTSDLFLPDRLRRHLGISDNARRYARDAYALSVLLASRTSIHLIVCQNDIHGDPLLPSRLLFRCDDQTRAARWLHFSEAVEGGESSVMSSQLRTDSQPHVGPSIFEVPKPRDDVAVPETLNVTDFKRYLECPYRFYLQRVLKLEYVDDDAREMDGARFGTLLHEALRHFGASKAKALDDSIAIYEALSRELPRCAAAVFGAEPLPAVRVQIEQALMRLKAFASIQARLRREGWEIAYVESDEMTKTIWTVDDHPMTIRGKVDRIDVHSESGRVRIIDYKTGDRGVNLDDLKDEEGNWTDLQLPLYCHLAKELGFHGPFEAAYLQLPRRVEDSELRPVEWDEHSLRQADRLAREVIRNVRKREFWPPAAPPPKYAQAWDDLCGVTT